MKYNILPQTTKKSAKHTCNKVNKNIRNKTVCCIEKYKDSNKEILTERINKLNFEWDTERVLETNAASIILLSSILGFRKKRDNCFILSGMVGFFLLMHALQGWCPPLPIIRKFGVRTAEEISEEKFALKHLRGDFSDHVNEADKMLENAEK
ncbi:YgaP family membrane protein [Lacrimispora sp. 38-1]|uniref:YgaP family membrane protein n=1 Tax=Lacrimispora sp. 38-1 TaxID=3125778 RepID=UPI003CFABBEB